MKKLCVQMVHDFKEYITIVRNEVKVVGCKDGIVVGA